MWPRQKHPFEHTVPEARAEGHAPIALEIDPEMASRLRRLASRRGEAPEALACGLLARGLDVELRRHQAEASLDRLTPRQRDVAWLASQGNTNRQIAAALYVSTETVKTHMAHVLGKFGLHTKADLRLLLADLGPPPGASHPARLPEALRSLSVELDPVRG